MATPDRPTQSVITELVRQLLPDAGGKEARLLTIEYAPGVHTPAHRHPGAVFVYVVEGTLTHQMEGDPPRQYRPGEHWYEAPGLLHADAGNDSTATNAKIVAFYVAEPGAPVLVFEDAGLR